MGLEVGRRWREQEDGRERELGLVCKIRLFGKKERKNQNI